MYVCMYVCVYACVDLYVYVYFDMINYNACMQRNVYIHMSLTITHIGAFMPGNLYVIYVCVCVCMHVRMHRDGAHTCVFHE
jgi:hypothetical protein